MADWIDLISGELAAEDEASLLSKGASELNGFLVAHPDAPQEVLEMLSRRLDGRADSQTWEVLFSLLTNYMGRDLALMLAWLCRADQGIRLRELEKYATQAEMAFLHKIVALYGPEMERALDVWTRDPEEWKTLYREVYYDYINRRYHIKATIEKYNGEKVVIAGPADTIMDLTTSFVRTLGRWLGPEAFDTFPPRRSTQFLEEVGGVLKLLAQTSDPARQEQLRGFLVELLNVSAPLLQPEQTEEKLAAPARQSRRRRK